MPQQPATSFDSELAALRASQQKPADDDFGAELQALRASVPEQHDSRSLLARAVDAARTPLLPVIGRAGHALANVIDPPDQREKASPLFDTVAQATLPTFLQGHVSPGRLRSLIAGGVEGAGDLAAGMTSPLDLVLMGTGLKSVRDAGRGIGAIARGVNAVGSAALAARGAERTADSQSIPDVGMGLLEMAGGAAGVHGAMSKPVPAPVRIRGRLTGAPIAVTPAGEAIPAGLEIPMRPTAPGGGFAADLEALRSSRPAAPIGRNASGEIVYSGDPNASAVDVGPRGLLPERTGPRFAATADGQVIDALQGGADAADVARQLPTLDSGLPSKLPSASRKANAGELVPARVMDREFEGARVTNQHFSSDPSLTADAPKVQMSDVERAELRRILKEMENMPFTSHTFNPVEVGHGGAYEVVGGAAGAPVFHDITQGRSGTRASVTEAIAGMLEGKHSAMGQRALDVARGRLRGAPELSTPSLPPDAGDLPQSGQMNDADFNEFDRFVNRLSDEDHAGDMGRTREPGEEGFSNPQLLMHAGGAVVGGAVGAATGDTPEERIKRGIAGAVFGGLAPAAVRIAGSRAPGLATVGEQFNARGTSAPSGSRIVSVGGVPVAGAPDGVSSFATSARQPGMPSQPHADPLAGTDVFLAKFPDEVRGGIRQIIEDNQGFDAQRRGAVDPQTTQRLADGVAVDLSRTLKPGTALNAQGVRAYADALAGAQQKINTLAEKVTRGAATDADVVALEAARSEAKTVAASIMGGRSEAGRALAEFKVLARVLERGSPQQIADAAQTLRGQARQFAQDFSQLPDDPLTRYRWLQERERPTFTDRARSYFYSNILSGAKTHERNIIGNASNALLNVAAQPFGAAADLTRSLMTGAPREVLFSELKPQAAGALIGIPQGIKEMLYTLKNGVTQAQVSGAMSAAEAGKLDLPHSEFAGGGANPFNWPMRGLNAADQFFRAVGKNQELYALAFQQAKREGLTGARLQDRMAHLVTGTDEVSQGLQQRASDFARRVVFQEKPGKFAQGIQMLAKQFPPLSFVVPFIKTPANIIRQGFEFSPAGFAMSAAREGGRPGAQAMGRAAAGSFGLGYLAYLASTGKLSGSGPTDPAPRAQLMESGWRPNSVRVGERWVSYMPIQPISTPAAVVADAFDAWRDAGANADTATKVATAIARTVKSQLNQSFLSGLADFITAVEQGEGLPQKAVNAVSHAAGGMVPFSGALRTATAATDPMVRAPHGMAETLATGLPGASSGVPARLDRFGNEIAREGGPARRALDPFNTSTENHDPVLAELGRLGVHMGMPSGAMKLPGGLEVTHDESRQEQQGKGQAAYGLLQQVIAAPGYGRLRDDQKADVLERAIGRARQLAGRQVKDGVIRGRIQQLQQGQSQQGPGR